MKLEEMQELADAISTIEYYNKQYWVKAIALFFKGLSWLVVGFLVQSGFELAKWAWQ